MGWLLRSCTLHKHTTTPPMPTSIPHPLAMPCHPCHSHQSIPPPLPPTLQPCSWRAGSVPGLLLQLEMKRIVRGCSSFRTIPDPKQLQAPKHFQLRCCGKLCAAICGESLAPRGPIAPGEGRWRESAPRANVAQRAGPVAHLARGNGWSPSMRGTPRGEPVFGVRPAARSRTQGPPPETRPAKGRRPPQGRAAPTDGAGGRVAAVGARGVHPALPPPPTTRNRTRSAAPSSASVRYPRSLGGCGECPPPPPLGVAAAPRDTLGPGRPAGRAGRLGQVWQSTKRAALRGERGVWGGKVEWKSARPFPWHTSAQPGAARLLPD